MQVMLDKGKDLDWFNSSAIVTLACVAVVGFAVFLIWELTEEHPIVDLTLFRSRNFSVSTVAMLFAYGLFFGNVVLLPLGLPQYMGYTPTLGGRGVPPAGLHPCACGLGARPGGLPRHRAQSHRRALRRSRRSAHPGHRLVCDLLTGA